jgi:general secretion pathway protein H
MVVVAIIAGTSALVIPKIANRSNQTKATIRELTVLSRQLHMKAKLNGSTYRLVIDMKEGDRSKAPQTYWVEKSNGSTLAKAGEESLKPEKDKDGKEIKNSTFEMDMSIFKKPKELKSGLRFEKVELSRLHEPLTSGRAFIHYLPQGLVEEAAIHLKSEKDQRWTISIQPLTGKAEVVTESVSLHDMKSQ